jgi:hypothetical protein
MLQLKNTINCPGCKAVLRVSARVLSDGKEYVYYFCSACQDVAKLDPASQEWVLRGAPSAKIPELVRDLQAVAVDDWAVRATNRSTRITKLNALVGTTAKPSR